MRIPGFLRGLPVVATQEFLGNLRSVRLLIMAVVLALVVVGGAYGISGLGGGGFSAPPPVVAWGHASFGPVGEHLVVVWVSNPFGVPLDNRRVTFTGIEGQVAVPLGEARTDANGFARFDVGNRSAIAVVAESGTASYSTAVFYAGPPPHNFTTASFQYDLDGDGRLDDVGFQVLDLRGTPAAAALSLNGTFATNVDSLGYARVELPPGLTNVTIEVGGERETIPFFVSTNPPSGPPLSTGPDFVLVLIALGFAGFVIPIFAIAITFDAVSKERVQGTLDLLLSRPASRVGILLGKFVGSFAAVAVPVTLVNLAGIGVLTLVSGKAPTGGFALAFIGMSFVLIAFYVLLQLTLSTVAKTSGTAVLFGVLIWLAFNVLYPVITFILASVLFANDPAAQFGFLQASGLGNPTSVYQALVVLAAPPALGNVFGGGTAYDASVVATAGAGWFAVLLALALWTFRRRAAE